MSEGTYDRMMPVGRDSFSLNELAKIWDCSLKNVVRQVKDGSLKTIPQEAGKKASWASRRAARSSVIDFLKICTMRGQNRAAKAAAKKRQAISQRCVIGLPEGRDSFRVSEIASILSHSEKQVQNLIDDGDIAVIDPTVEVKTQRRVSREELTRFIISRTSGPTSQSVEKKTNPKKGTHAKTQK